MLRLLPNSTINLQRLLKRSGGTLVSVYKNKPPIVPTKTEQATIKAIQDRLSAGGAGSGCHGDNCGRPVGSHTEPTTGSEGQKPSTEEFTGIRNSVVIGKNKQIVADVLNIVQQRFPALAAMMVNYPIRKVKWTPNAVLKDAKGNTSRTFGFYDWRTNRIEISTTVDLQTINRTWMPSQSWGTTDGAKTPAELVAHVLAHEIGHYFDRKFIYTERLDPRLNIYNKLGNSASAKVMAEAVKADYQKAVTSGIILTRYAKTNISEFFAESFAAYFTNPSDLKRYHSATYGVIDKLVASKGTKRK